MKCGVVVLGLSLLPLLLPVVLAGCASTGGADFGEPMKLSDSDVTPVAKVIASPKDYDGKYLRLRGQVVSVCAKKGCWLRMAPAGDQSPADNLFVKFTCPVDGRLIPMAAVGRETIVEGTLEVATVSEDEARHLAEDAGKSAEEIAKIVGDRIQLKMKSPSAHIVGLSQPAPPVAPTSQPTK